MRYYQKKLAFVLVLAFSLILAAGAAMADETPAFKQYSDIVYTGFVQKVVDGEIKGMIIDSRPKIKMYDKGHVPGAVSIPWSQFDDLKNLLPADKNATLVFYCGGFHCALSHKSAFAAQAMGYKNIKVYAAGYPAWVEANGAGPSLAEDEARAATGEIAFETWPREIYTADVIDMVDQKVVGMIVDSRPKIKMYDKGHVPGSVSIPWTAFDKMKGLLPADKDALLVFYCGGYHCALSHKSAFAAAKLGYRNIKVYAAGYPAWQSIVGTSGSGAAKAAAAPASDGPLKAGKEEGSVDLAFFEDLLKKSPDTILLVDVRDAPEYEAGHLPTAINISVDDLEEKLPGMKIEKPVVFVCSTGARSGEAYYMVQDLRPDLKGKVYYLDAEVAYKDGGYTLTPPK